MRKKLMALLMALAMAAALPSAALAQPATETLSDAAPAQTGETAAEPPAADEAPAEEATTTTLAAAPVSQAYLDYLESGATGGYVPSMIDASQFSIPRLQESGVPSRQATEFPAKYDLRTLGTVSGVKNQSPNGSCWSFAATASIESGLIQKYPWVDLSERHTVFSSFDFAGGTLPGSEDIVNWGGWNQISTATLSHFYGPVAENRCPYVPYESITEELREQSEFHLTDVGYLPALPTVSGDDHVSAEIIKQLVLDKGAVSIAYKAVDEYIDEEHCSSYTPESDWANHQVTLIGWDDTFPKENFAIEAPGDGAWLIKNSWGSSKTYQEGGYFWLSYYDASMVDGAFYEVSEENMNQQAVYYDATGWSMSLYDVDALNVGNPTITAANVFTADADLSLQAVGLYTGDSNTEVRVDVYTDADGDWQNAWSADRAAAQGRSYEPYAGYHTITLDSALALDAGDRYAIVYTALNTNEGKPGYMPIEVNTNYLVNNTNAVINPGESYFYDQDKAAWIDLCDVAPIESNIYGTITYCNPCISAIVVPDGTAPVPVPEGTDQALLSSMMTGTNPKEATPLAVFETPEDAGAPISAGRTPVTAWSQNLSYAQDAYLWPVSTGTIKINGAAAETVNGFYHPTKIAKESLKVGDNPVTIEVSASGKTTTTYTLTLVVAPEPTPTPTAKPTPTAAPDPAIEQFVSRLYAVCLDRQPDAKGKAGWSAMLRSGEKTGAAVAYGFVFSPEFTGKKYDNTAYVQRLYRALLGREAEAASLTGWVAKLDSGALTRQQVLEGFSASLEFAKLCKGYGIKAV